MNKLQIITNKFNSIINLTHIDDDLGMNLIRMKMTMRVSLISAIFGLLYSIFLFCIGLTQETIICLFQPINYAFVMVFIYKRQFELAKILHTLTANWGIFAFASMLGIESGVHFYTLLAPIFVLSLYELNERYKIIISISAYIFTFFFYLKHNINAVFPRISEEILSEEILFDFFAVNIIFIIILSTLLISYVLRLNKIFFVETLEKRKVDLQNEELKTLTEQLQNKNHLLENAQQHIRDSINYAKRIQNASLPPRNEILKILPNSFILYKPKDIVSGDFYWFEEKDNHIYIAAADSTGHGVPGALISMLGLNKLNEMLDNTDNISDLLHYLNQGIKKSLRQSDYEESTKDGLEIALCKFDFDTNELHFAGANRPLWLIRKTNHEILEEIKGTKAGIGGSTEMEQIFESYSTILEKGDTIYISSDGYADQTGGKNNKKLKTKYLKELLISIGDKNMHEQKAYLENFLIEWKGKNEQIDDILIMGIRI